MVKQKGKVFLLNTIYRLFSGVRAKGACKVAGLPKPTGCA
jgi:sulfur relay (sulfurtransferase) DsrC/TusE family protein